MRDRPGWLAADGAPQSPLWGDWDLIALELCQRELDRARARSPSGFRRPILRRREEVGYRRLAEIVGAASARSTS